jgi:hypothetical protein
METKNLVANLDYEVIVCGLARKARLICNVGYLVGATLTCPGGNVTVLKFAQPCQGAVARVLGEGKPRPYDGVWLPCQKKIPRPTPRTSKYAHGKITNATASQ